MAKIGPIVEEDSSEENEGAETPRAEIKNRLETKSGRKK